MSRSGGNRKNIIFIIIAVSIAVTGIYYIRKSKSDHLAKYEYVNYEKITAVNNYDSLLKNKSEKSSTIKYLPVRIDAFDNFQDYRQQFLIPRDTMVTVHAVGEAADYTSNPYLFKSWDNDGIEVYFDMNNEKYPYFDINKDDRQYRILWKTHEIAGQNVEKQGVGISESDPSATSYVMEISFTWKSLGYLVPHANAKLGFDIALIDCDGGSMKAELNWHSKSDDAWKNTSLYGTMILGNDKNAKMDNDHMLAVKRPFLSSKPFGNNAPFYKFQYVSIGHVTDSLDLSGKFQAEWDDRALYLRVFVTDNVKTVAQALFDYGWIENASGDIIWKMDLENLKYAGGALKNKKTDTTVFLKKGVYSLNYHTDESHAPVKWDDLPPENSFYGIQLSYK